MFHFATLAIATAILTVLDGSFGGYIIFAGFAFYSLMFAWLTRSPSLASTLLKCAMLIAFPLGAYFVLKEYQPFYVVEILLTVVRQVFLPASLVIIAHVGATKLKAKFARPKVGGG
jgi:hypothetical protein